MCYKEKADAGQNLQDPMLTRITATAQPDLTKTKDTAIRGREKERFFKAHFSMSEISKGITSISTYTHAKGLGIPFFCQIFCLQLSLRC